MPLPELISHYGLMGAIVTLFIFGGIAYFNRLSELFKLRQIQEADSQERHRREIERWFRYTTIENGLIQHQGDKHRQQQHDDMMTQHLALNEKPKNDDKARNDRLSIQDTPVYIVRGGILPNSREDES